MKRCNLASFFRELNGNVVVVFGLLAPVLLILLSGGIDYARWVSTQADIQTAADTAALAGAKELRLANANSQAVIAAAKNRALASLGTQAADAVVDAEIQGQNAILVKIDLKSDSLFGNLAPTKFTHIHAQAMAQTASMPTCLIALDPTGKGLDLETALITAKGCATYSNSQRRDGLKVKLGTVLAAQTCSAGGAEILTGVVLPLPITDCPVISDPLASRPPPTYGACDYYKKVVSQGTVSLSPGVYCGGLSVTNGATANLAPGLYVIVDGELSVDQEGTLQGTEVGFYFAGDKAMLDFDVVSTISLVAPKSGPLAGILFFEDPSAKLGRKHFFGARHATLLLGTFYFPRGILTIGKKDIDLGQILSDVTTCTKLKLAYPCIPPQADLAILSAWTIVIAREIHINFLSNLVLNSNYSSSNTGPPAEFALKGATLSQ